MNTETDVIIIGAGPAGLSAAIKLEELEVEYLLFDRDIHPGEAKPCAGYIPISTIRRLKIPTINDEHVIDSVRLQFSGREPITIEFEEALGINVSRGALSQAMLSMTSNATNHHFGTKIVNIKTSEKGCEVLTRKNGSESKYSSKLIIDATGVNSVTQRFAPLRERIPNAAMGYGVQYHIEYEEELPNVNTFLYGSEFSPRGYSWLFPREKTMVMGTGGLVETIRNNETKTQTYLNKLLKEIEPYKSELSKGTIVKKDSALMPLAGIVQPSFGKRIMLAGDAAGHCSPISGEGIHYSMMGGLLAAVTASKSVEKNNFSNKFLSKYEKAWMREIGSDLKWGHWLQRRLLKPGNSGTSGWNSTGFIDSERSLRIICEMLLGDRSVRSAILAIVPGYLKTKVTR